MSIETQNFESHFGFSLPQIIIDLFTDNEIKRQMPTRFRFNHVAYVLELQYFLDITNSENYDIENGKCRFAVTTDGFELLVDLNSEKLEIFQDEFGDIDSLGISVKDLIEAEKESI